MSPSVVPVRSNTRSSYVQLLDAIIRGRLAPGVRVVEAEVAERLGISRTPAREVIQRLHQEGFLVAVGSGLRTQVAVAPLTVDDMQDLYSIMGALEGAAARRAPRLKAAERRSLVKRLRIANERFVKVAKGREHDLDELFERHNAFHQEIVRSCATPRLLSLIERVRPQVDRYEYMYAPLVGPDHEATFAEHAAIIRTMRDGTPTAADHALRANWLNSAERLQVAMERAGPRGVW